ncbi:hypothetical protein [Clostridium psychrophilum]|uniref:hypothetical protein n=1 Tax=Clostridium psychrophilum TaxID=132926 RepID=UPI001C0D510A|nr:hypothetical protein [Clostridium psychrophilum]MBU3180189.1 hypothetical protein [Clostridium psychrophilum]
MTVKEDKIKYTYPLNEWKIIEDEFKAENNYSNETMFSLGNGYIGMRGNFEEGFKGVGSEGTFINGFYESNTINYGEMAYGYAQKTQTMINVTNSKVVKLFIENEEFDMLKGKILSYKRVLNLQEGLLKRVLKWRSPKGKEVEISIQRLISFTNKHIVAIKYNVCPLNFNGQVKLISYLDGDVTNLTSENDPRVGSGFQGRMLDIEYKKVDNEKLLIKQRTKNTKFSLICTANHKIKTSCKYKVNNSVEEFRVNAGFTFDGKIGKRLH